MILTWTQSSRNRGVNLDTKLYIARTWTQSSIFFRRTWTQSSIFDAELGHETSYLLELGHKAPYWTPENQGDLTAKNTNLDTKLYILMVLKCVFAGSD